jgi:diguanylate cyclase (GGDEF)-like protein/PAS domain S-box-containing protein
MIEAALDAMADAIVVFDDQARIVAANARAVVMSGVSVGLAQGKRLSDIARGDESFRQRQPFWELLEVVIVEVIRSGRDHRDDDASRVSLEGEVVSVALWIHPIRSDDGITGAVMVIRDHVAGTSMVFRRASVGMAHIDRHGLVREANRSLLDLLGRDDLDMRAQPFVAFAHPSDVDAIRPALDDVVNLRAESRRLEARFLHADGSIRWVDLSIASNGIGNGDVGGACAVLEDITDRVTLATELAAAHEQLRELAHHDPLTGLGNRTRLADDLAAAQGRAAVSGTHVAVLFIDLDGFKQVNDTDGHEAGDRLLVQVGERLKHLLRPGDSAARIGGDEFIVCCGELDPSVEVATTEADAIASRVRAALTAPFEVLGAQWTLGASIGVALSLAGADTPDELLRSADVAMYRAKARGV